MNARDTCRRGVAAHRERRGIHSNARTNARIPTVTTHDQQTVVSSLHKRATEVPCHAFQTRACARRRRSHCRIGAWRSGRPLQPTISAQATAAKRSGLTTMTYERAAHAASCLPPTREPPLRSEPHDRYPARYCNAPWRAGPWRWHA